MRSGWEGYTDASGAHFKSQLLFYDACKISRRQLEDWHHGAALMAAAFEPDERFIGGSSMEERIRSMQMNEDIDALLRPPS